MLRPLSLAFVLLGACGSTREAPPPAPDTVRLPASALAGAVRALATIDAVRPPGTLTQVRAVECDTMTDPADRDQIVRVFLDLTVFAPTPDGARAAFEQVRAALETEAQASSRTEPATAEQVRRAVVFLDWNPPGDERLASYSDRVRLEVAPGRAVAAAPVAALSAETDLSPIATYIRSVATRESFGQVDLSVTPTDDELRVRISENSPSSRHRRETIGRFLSALESGSPAVRLTRVSIEPSQAVPNPGQEDAWTLEAELTVVDAVAPQPAAAAGPR
jgi:hypothetical protein